jgi:hypothetical protein
MLCNRVLASSTCHHQPIRSHLVQTRGSARTAAPPGDRADRRSAVGPAGHVDQRRSPRLRIYKATRHVAAARRCADTITQHKRCDLSTHGGGASYSVSGKTARVTGITVRGDLPCRSPVEMPRPTSAPSAKESKPQSYARAAACQSSHGIPAAARAVRADRWWAVPQRRASAADKQARQTS